MAVLQLRWNNCIRRTNKWNRVLSVRDSTTTSATVDPELVNARHFDEIPGIKGFWNGIRMVTKFLPTVGKYNSVPLRLADIHAIRYKQFGNIHRFDTPLFGPKLVFVYNPDDIRKVFQHEGRQPTRHMLAGLRVYRRSRPHMYGSGGILVDNGEDWYQTRSKVQVPMMRPQMVHAYVPAMASVSDDFVNRMKALRDKQGEIPNYLNELYKWALESIDLVAFNTRLGCLADNLAPHSEAQRMITAVNDTFEATNQLDYGLPLWRLYPTAPYKKAAQCQDYFHKVANKYIQLTMERMAKQSDNDGGTDAGILGILLQKPDLDRRELFTFILDLLQAGIDTTGHSVAFSLYLLARNLDKQDRIHAELQKLPSGPVTAETLNRVPYLKACVKEAMRLMPVVDFTSRQLDHDIALAGYRIPAGVYIQVMTQFAARQPQYFKQPDAFLPERWLEPTEKTHPFANLPFGHGPRTCIGRRIAVQEIHLLLIKMLRVLRVEYHHADIGRRTRFVNMPDKPLKFSFVDR